MLTDKLDLPFMLAVADDNRSGRALTDIKLEIARLDLLALNVAPT